MEAKPSLRTVLTCVVWVSRVSQWQQNTPEGCGSWSQPGWGGHVVPLGVQGKKGTSWDQPRLIGVELWQLGSELSLLPPSV